MTKYEFKKFPLLAVILTLVGLVLSVIAISVSLIVRFSDGGIAALALLEIIAAVLVLAGLTTGRVILLRVISIILTVSLLITSFVLTIVKFSDRDVFLFAIALLMLIASVLELIYFLTLKNPRIKLLYFISGLCFSGLVFLYGLVYVGIDVYEAVTLSLETHYNYYFLLFGFSAISALPVAIYNSLTKKEEAEEPQVEQIEEQGN